MCPWLISKRLYGGHSPPKKKPFKTRHSPAAAHAELFHVLGLCFLRFGVGVSILEFFWPAPKPTGGIRVPAIAVTASLGAIRLVCTVRCIVVGCCWCCWCWCSSLPVHRWYDDRSRPRIDSKSIVPCSKLIKSSSPKIS